tara:strand:+ start:189 stop:305 length:117 start_codon:yes stop_codon:yes gene_type:complete
VELHLQLLLVQVVLVAQMRVALIGVQVAPVGQYPLLAI